MDPGRKKIETVENVGWVGTKFEIIKFIIMSGGNNAYSNNAYSNNPD